MEKAQVRQEVNEWLAGYRPLRMSDRRWVDTGLRDFVREQIVRLDPAGVAYAKKCARVLARLADWCLDQGMDLDVERVLDPDTVDRFTSICLADDEHAATYRSLLRNMGPKLTKKAPWEPRPEPLARRHLTAPFEAEEIRGFVRAITQQRTPVRARSLQVFLALGCGAGLDGRWVHRIRTQDVRVGDHHVIVDVPEPSPRQVPVLAEWEPMLLDAVASAEEGDTLLGGEPKRNTVSGRIEIIELGRGLPAVSCARFRSTWLVHHLSRGTRLPELVAATGTKTLTSLSDLLPYVDAVPDDEAVQQLRGV